MKQIIKGIFVVLVTLGLWAIAFNVKAGTQAELLKLITGKVIVHDGVCMLNKKGLFPDPKVTEPTTEYSCVVGVDMNEAGEIYYVLIRDKRGNPMNLIVADKDKNEQKIVWRAGVET